MRCRTARKIGGIILVAVLTVASWSLHGLEVAPIFNVEWQWITLGGLILFMGLFIHKFYSTDLRLQEYEHNRPVAVVTPKAEDNFACLTVTNMGQYKAEFGIQLSGWQGIGSTEPPIRSSYYGKWKDYDSAVIPMIPEDNKEVDIIQHMGCHLEDQEKTNTRIRRLVIRDVGGTQWVARMQVGSKLKFSVQVIAAPKLKTSFKRTYILTVGDTGWTQFQELEE